MPITDPDFLLPTSTAQAIFAEIEHLPVYDLHTHVDLKTVLENQAAPDPWTALCHGDHYISSIIETLGGMSREKFYATDTTPNEKWQAFAQVFPSLIGNPVRDWMRQTLTELGVKHPLNAQNAQHIWNELSQTLQQDRWRPVEIFKNANIALMSTTNNPTDTLEEHEEARARAEELQCKWVPTWRPDFLLNLRPNPMTPRKWIDWLHELESVTGMSIKGDWKAFLNALKNRHDFFATRGCLGSDYGLIIPDCHDVAENRAATIFQNACTGSEISESDAADFQSYLLRFSMEMDFEKGWFSQIHFGPARNQRRIAQRLGGIDSGCDTLNSTPQLVPMFHDLLNHFDTDENRINRRIILYCSAKADWERVAGLARIIPSVYVGMAWWYFDSVSGMLEYFRTVPDIGAGFRKMGPFVTDARNIYSLKPRTQVYRRCLATALAELVDIRKESLEEVVELARMLCSQTNPGITL